ncbi:MAG TPA: hypothetical protein VGG45_13060 [Terracidiphilus sp.]|jgi:hypothetical protein
MSRDEVIRLVSRALGCIEAIQAALDASYLPTRFMTLHHDLKMAKMYAAAGDSGAFGVRAHYIWLDRVDIAFFFGRIALLLSLALLFWNCGPRIARFLLPERKQSSAAS